MIRDLFQTIFEKLRRFDGDENAASDWRPHKGKAELSLSLRIWKTLRLHLSLVSETEKQC